MYKVGRFNSFYLLFNLTNALNFIKHVYFYLSLLKFFFNCVTHLLDTLLYRLSVCDWFYIRQAYSVASIGSMEFYNKIWIWILNLIIINKHKLDTYETKGLDIIAWRKEHSAMPRSQASWTLIFSFRQLIFYCKY
jgi:hypothetical protein